METIKPYLFKTGEWRESHPPDVLFLEPLTPAKGREVAEDLEKWLISEGIADDCKPKDMAHFNLAGVEAWRIDFRDRTFKRIEAFEMQFEGYHPRTHTVAKCSFQQLKDFLSRPGTYGKKFGL